MANRTVVYGFFTLALCLMLNACKPQTATEAGEESGDAMPAKANLASGIRMDYIDSSASPQQDFFNYANGAWIKNTKIPEDKSRYGAFDILTDKARDDVQAIVQNAGSSADAKTKGTEAQQIADFYQSYMDTDTVEKRGLAPLQSAFAAIDSIKDYSALSAYFATANRHSVDSPLGFYIDTDEKHPDQYIAYFGQSGLGLPDRDYYLKDDEKFTQIQQQYRQHITTMLQLAGLSEDPAIADKIYAMEKALAEIQWPREQLRDREKNYNKIARTKLLEGGDHLNWQAYLSDSGLDKSDNFVFSALSYFEGLDDAIATFPLADWQWYMKWQTLSHYAPLLPQALDQENFNFYGKTLRGIEQQEERWKRAINTLNSQVGDPIGKLYVAQHFSPEAKQRMVALVENLREAYRQSILELDWMGAETKQKAIEKLKKFNPKIGYPDKWKDYSQLDIRPGDLFGNMIRANEFHYDYEINKLGKPIDRSEWFMTPQTVNAYYNPGMNEIVFPAAILQPPFFNMEADDAINYGAIGGVIGHEMGHGFDDQGAKSDGDGLLKNWWTEQDFAEFKRRTDKLVAQYSGYSVLEGLAVNGNLTQGENIGDLGGLTIAYKAYQLSLNSKTPPVLDGFSGDQRFFLGWAQVWAIKYRDEELRRRILTDPHSPGQFRANGVLRNLPTFYAAFDVKPGDGMYLDEAQRVKIW